MESPFLPCKSMESTTDLKDMLAMESPTTCSKIAQDTILALSSITKSLLTQVQELSESLQMSKEMLEKEKEGRSIAEHRAKHMYMQVMYIASHPNRRRVQPSIALYPTNVPPIQFPQHLPAHIRESVCGICFDYLDANGWYTLGCGHPFHLCCITRSLVSKCKCPVCRFEVDEVTYMGLGIDDLFPGIDRMIDVDTGIPMDFAPSQHHEEVQPRREWYDLDQLEPSGRSLMDKIIPQLLSSSEKCELLSDFEESKVHELEHESRPMWIHEQHKLWQQLVESHGQADACTCSSEIGSISRVATHSIESSSGTTHSNT